MIRSFTERRLMALSVAAGALALGSGATGLAMSLASGPAAAPAATASPAAVPVNASILCLAILHQWGVCIGPPTT